MLSCSIGRKRAWPEIANGFVVGLDGGCTSPDASTVEPSQREGVFLVR